MSRQYILIGTYAARKKSKKKRIEKANIDWLEKAIGPVKEVDLISKFEEDDLLGESTSELDLDPDKFNDKDDFY